MQPTTGAKLGLVRDSIRLGLVAFFVVSLLPLGLYLVQTLRGKQTSSLYSEMAIELNPDLGPAILVMTAAYTALSVFGGVAFGLNHRKSMLCVSILMLVGLAINLTDSVFNDNAEARKLRSQELADHLRPMLSQSWLGWPLNLLKKIQLIEQCCGIDGPADWDPSRPMFWASDWYPLTCCPIGDIDKGEFCTRSRVYQDGCKQKIVDLATKVGKHLGIVLAIQLVLGCAGLFVVWLTPKPADKPKTGNSSNNNYRNFLENN